MNRRYHGPEFYILLPFFLFFFAVPYLFDVAYCEELYGTPLSQAALIEGEKVDPHETHSVFRALDCATGLAAKAGHTYKSFPLFRSLENRCPRAQVPVLLMSRPPPAL